MGNAAGERFPHQTPNAPPLRAHRRRGVIISAGHYIMNAIELIKPPPFPASGFDVGDRSPHIAVAKSILRSQGYDIQRLPTDRKDEDFTASFAAELAAFQGSHTGKDGKPLAAIGRLGPKTWWALHNPSGAPQRAFMTQIKDVTNTTPERETFVQTLIGHWRENVFERPDGSNWGDGVTKILTHAGGPRAWCMHSISYDWKKAFGEYPLGKDHGHVLTFVNACKAKGFTRGKDYMPEPGDLGFTLYTGPRGHLTGSGHIWAVVAIEKPRRGVMRYNHVGGNEGNRLKLGLRTTADESLSGWINLFGDAHLPTDPMDYGLAFSPDAQKAQNALASTR